jgi:hypothetical protein
MGRFARLGVLIAVLLMATAQAGARANQANFGSQDAERQLRDAVEIGNDSGGFVADYAIRLYEMRQARQKVRFVGVCDSACTLFLALPAEQTCITKGTYFRFHAPSAPAGYSLRNCSIAARDLPANAAEHASAPGWAALAPLERRHKLRPTKAEVDNKARLEETLFDSPLRQRARVTTLSHTAKLLLSRKPADPPRSRCFI